MANVFAPNGFNAMGVVGGFTPNGAERTYEILASNTTAIFHGDIVALSGGYLVQATATSTPVGVFVGCEFQMAALNNQTRWSPFWPGSGATSGSTPTGYVVDDPDLQMIVQSGTGGPVSQTSVGTGINLNVGTGNTTTGVSGMFADFSTVGTGTQFVIMGLTANNNANGGDNTTAGNSILVSFLNHVYKA